MRNAIALLTISALLAACGGKATMVRRDFPSTRPAAEVRDCVKRYLSLGSGGIKVISLTPTGGAGGVDHDAETLASIEVYEQPDGSSLTRVEGKDYMLRYADRCTR